MEFGVSEEKVMEVRERKSYHYDMAVRTVALACSLVAAVMEGLNEETRTIAVSIVQTLPPLNIPVTAKWYYLSSLVYFVASNGIACTYAAASLALCIMTRAKKQYNITLLLLILDLVMVALLFSANGAATFVGIIALKGNSHLQWHKVCSVFENFCRRSSGSLASSWLGSFAFMWLVILATLNLHKKSR